MYRADEGLAFLRSMKISHGMKMVWSEFWTAEFIQSALSP